MARALSNLALLIALCSVFIGTRPAEGQSLIPDSSLLRTVAVRDVRLEDGIVTGVVENLSRNSIRDVQLLIEHRWVWTNDQDPGPVNPGTASYLTLSETIPPGGQTRFSFRLPSGDVSPDAPGSFTTSVQPVGVTELELPPG